MNKIYYVILALIVLIFLGFLHSRKYYPTATITTSKTVVVKEQPQTHSQINQLPPNAYIGVQNPYKAQYYN
jgi:hypothetical protein